VYTVAKNYHHILLSECVSERGLGLYLCTQWPRTVIIYCYLSVYLRGDCVCTCVHSGQEVTIPLLTQHMYQYVCNVPKYTVTLEGGVVQHCQSLYSMSSGIVHYTQHMTCAWQPRYGYRDLSDILYVALTIRYLFKGHTSTIRTKITLTCLKSL